MKDFSIVSTDSVSTAATPATAAPVPDLAAVPATAAPVPDLAATLATAAPTAPWLLAPTSDLHAIAQAYVAHLEHIAQIGVNQAAEPHALAAAYLNNPATAEDATYLLAAGYLAHLDFSDAHLSGLPPGWFK